jgi:hypothetical protein
MRLALRRYASFSALMVSGFPVGPYRLSGKFVLYRALGVAVCVLVALGCVAIYTSMAWDSASLLLHDQRVWSMGGVELPAGVDGEVTTRQFVLNSYDLKVHYDGPDGRRHDLPLKFDSLGSMPDDQATTVRLAPGNAEDFALNSAVAISGKRWASAVFFGVIGVFLLGGAFGFLGFAAGKQWRRVGRAAKLGAPLRCQLLGRERILNNGKDTGAEKLTFRVPAAEPGRPPRDVAYQFRTKGNEVLTLDGGASVLAIVPPDAPEQAILLLSNFYPLKLGDQERRQAEQAVR